MRCATFYLLLFLLAVAAPARAQDSERIGEVAPMVGYGVARLQWPTLAEHFASYTAYNANSGLLSAPTLGLARAQSVGATFGGGWVYVGWQGLAHNTAAVFANGAERHYQIRQGMGCINFEPTIHLSEHVFLAPVMSMAFGHNRVNQYFKYPDGTVSWGGERGNTGQYSAQSFAGTFGLKAGVEFGHVVVQLRGGWQAKRLKTDIGTLADDRASVFNTVPRNYDQWVRANGSLLGPYSPLTDAVQYDLRVFSALLEVGWILNPAN